MKKPIEVASIPSKRSAAFVDCVDSTSQRRAPLMASWESDGGLGHAPLMSLHKPTPRIPIPQATAGCCGFAAFSVASFAGAISGNPIDVVLSRAMIALVCGFVGGFLIGIVCDWIVGQEVSRIEAVVEEDTKEIEAAAASRSTLEGVEVLDEEELGAVEERGPRRRSSFDSDASGADSDESEEKNAA